jgi:thiamine pyrophosphate-dependent acetolactate synthase large subunit-like protein
VVTTHADTQLHGGRLIARGLAAAGISKLFTLSGGHLFSIYDGCQAEGIELIDVRHEQSAVFAAEGWAKVTRSLGVCALTAGPGVTNGVSAIASARDNHSPVLVLGGRAPAFRWGQGSLQEFDHVPVIAPLAKLAATTDGAAEIPELLERAMRDSLTPHMGPTFIDFPLDHVFGTAEGPEHWRALPEPWNGPGADPDELSRAAALLRDAERPAIMAGSGLYWGRGETQLQALAEQLRVPVFLNGLGRGCLPADHELFFSRARSAGLRDADVAVVIGVPLDFRLGFGAAFADECELIAIDVAEPERDHPRPVSAGLYGSLPATLDALRDGAAGGECSAREQWLGSLREIEDSRRAEEAADLTDERAPLHPMRIYGELAQLLDRDAIVVGDGGDFVSFAGRVVDSHQPGCWLDPGPFGCLGAGPGQALAAKLAYPERQVLLLLGDGALGFSAIEFDTLARHGVAVVAVVGNNGIWALEKYPMESIYGYSVAAELRPETRYDKLAEALGCQSELVRAPSQLRPALERAFAAGVPTLVNVLTDPAVAYPRRSNLA